MFFLKKMIYRCLLKSKFSNYDVTTLFKIVEAHNKYTVIESTEDAPTYTFKANDDIVAVKTKNEDVKDIYYKNIHLHRVTMEHGYLTTFELKYEGVDWEVPKKGNTYDFSSPLTETLEVYYNFDTIVLNRKRYCDEEYKEGEWDTYFYIAVREMEDIIQSYTLPAKFGEAYHKKIND